MADNPLLEYLRPMPETYDIQEPAGLPFMRAFGAGAIDPYGVTGWAVDKLGYGDWFGRRMQEMRAESPIAAGAGTGLTTGLLLNPAAGLTAMARNSMTPYGSRGISLGQYMGGIGPMAPTHGMVVGAGIGQIMDELGAVRRPPRAQGSYPPDEAY